MQSYFKESIRGLMGREFGGWGGRRGKRVCLRVFQSYLCQNMA
jgi:hypothetical protein